MTPCFFFFFCCCVCYVLSCHPREAPRDFSFCICVWFCCDVCVWYGVLLFRLCVMIICFSRLKISFGFVMEKYWKKITVFYACAHHDSSRNFSPGAAALTVGAPVGGGWRGGGRHRGSDKPNPQPKPRGSCRERREVVSKHIRRRARERSRRGGETTSTLTHVFPFRPVPPSTFRGVVALASDVRHVAGQRAEG